MSGQRWKSIGLQIEFMPAATISTTGLRYTIRVRNVTRVLVFLATPAKSSIVLSLFTTYEQQLGDGSANARSSLGLGGWKA